MNTYAKRRFAETRYVSTLIWFGAAVALFAAAFVNGAHAASQAQNPIIYADVPDISSESIADNRNLFRRFHGIPAIGSFPLFKKIKVRCTGSAGHSLASHARE